MNLKMCLPLLLVFLCIIDYSTQNSPTKQTILIDTSAKDGQKVSMMETISGVAKVIRLLVNTRNNDLNATKSINDTVDQKVKNRLEKEENLKKAEELRKEIAKRSGQLQEIITTAMDVMKTRGDFVIRRILENLNLMIDQAKTRADKILKEPSSSEMAIRTLNAINQGLNNVNRMITNVLQQINIRIIVDSNQDNTKKVNHYSYSNDTTKTL